MADSPPTNPTDRLFAAQRQADQFGRAVALAAGALCCFLLAWPTTFTEVAVVPLGLVWLWRVRTAWDMLGPGLKWPVSWLAVAFVLWQALSLTWSPDPRGGVEELGAARFAYLTLLLWPLLDRRDVLLGALLLGLSIGMLSQLAQATGHGFLGGQNRMPGRISGWWDPVVGGTILTAALGLALGLAASCRDAKKSALAAAGAAATLIAVIATGSRGAMLASLALLPIGAGVGLWLRRARGSSTRRAVMLWTGAGILLIAAGAAAVLSLPAARDRIGSAAGEVAAAIEDRDFDSDTGARVLMKWWAVEALMEHPLRGTGAGGFDEWVAAHLRDQNIDPATRRIHAHAHDALLHIAATLGLPGLALAIALVFFALRQSWQGLRHAPPADVAVALAALGLVLVSPFDPVHVNAQTSAIMWLLLILSHPRRPSIAPSAAPRAPAAPGPTA